MSYPTSKTGSSFECYKYGNILLRTYLEIAQGGDLKLLIISGKPSSETLIEAWEDIIKKNGKNNNGDQYDLYFGLLKGYAELIARHTIVSVQLEILFYKVDFKIIEEVRQAGYPIETTPANYASSLATARRKIKDLITKSEMKRKAIERLVGPVDKEANVISYEEIIGNLELSLDRTVMDSETLTLAKYNVLKRGIEERRKAHERANKKR